jgi:hypothetical protein
VKRIEEKYDYLAEYEQGGITYLKIALDEMFTMSNMVIQSLQKYLKQFAQEGIAKVPNEDVRLCSEQINAVCARLAEVDQLPQESTTFILEGFTRCSVTEFREIHKLLATTEKVNQMRVHTKKRDSSATLAAVNKLCSEACEVFHSLNLTNKWNIPQGHRTDAFIPVSCYNCGSPDHTADVCPKPRDEAKIKKAKEARDKAVKESRGGRGGSRGGGRGRGGRGGGRGDDRTNSRDKWGANGDSKRTDTISANGIEKRNGEWMMNCKSCGWNDTHTSGFHGEWSRNQGSFQLPSTHVFWTKSGKPSSEKAPGPASGTATSAGIPRGQLSGLISRYKTDTEDGAFASFLSEFEGLLK